MGKRQYPNTAYGMPKADNSQVQRFPTTQWSVVLAAQGANTSDSRQGQAFARLCETCWYPVYAFIRSRTRQRADAEDLTQDFFTSLLAYGSIDSAKPERGRFRAFRKRPRITRPYGWTGSDPSSTLCRAKFPYLLD